MAKPPADANNAAAAQIRSAMARRYADTGIRAARSDF
jgi:hypothetical protein